MKNALFIGAGAIENGWAPIIRALQPSYFKNQITIQAANNFLAQVVYLLRWQSSITKDLKNNPTFKIYKEHFNKVRNAIAREIQISQKNNEISVRKEFREIVEKMVLPNCESFMLVTTNWDTVVDDEIKNIPEIIEADDDWNISTAHLHGCFTNPDTMYLPSEVTKELYRSPKEDRQLGNLHSSVMRSLAESDKIILYGLSLSPLDAELLQTLAAGIHNSKIKCIQIVNPEHEIVAERMNLLLTYPSDIKVEGFDPSDLNHAYDYSI